MRKFFFHIKEKIIVYISTSLVVKYRTQIRQLQTFWMFLDVSIRGGGKLLVPKKWLMTACEAKHTSLNTPPPLHPQKFKVQKERNFLFFINVLKSHPPPFLPVEKKIHEWWCSTNYQLYIFFSIFISSVVAFLLFYFYFIFSQISRGVQFPPPLPGPSGSANWTARATRILLHRCRK